MQHCNMFYVTMQSDMIGYTHVEVLFLVLALLCIAWCSGFAIILTRKRAGCFTLIVFQMSCDSWCTVALTHDAVCDCGIS